MNDRVYSYSFDYIIDADIDVNEAENIILEQLNSIREIEVVGNPGINNTSWSKEEYGITSGCHGTSKKSKSKKKKPVKSSFDDDEYSIDVVDLLNDMENEGYNREVLEKVKEDWELNDVDELDEDKEMQFRKAVEKENLLYSSKTSKKQSFHVFSSVLVKNSSAIESKILKPGTFGIEADVNGWKIVNTEGKPAGGEPVEFDSEGDAKNSTIFKNLAERYGADKVRVYKQ